MSNSVAGYNIQRFVDKHNEDFDRAFKEIKNKRKVTHWMWYIFPQLKDLGYSFTAKYYGISSVEEVRAYMANPLLSKNMTKLCKLLLELDNCSAREIFGDVDARKLNSCMTLFYLVTNDDMFYKVLLKYNNGKLDVNTENLLRK